jgi:hypothetical protein
MEVELRNTLHDDATLYNNCLRCVYASAYITVMASESGKKKESHLACVVINDIEPFVLLFQSLLLHSLIFSQKQNRNNTCPRVFLLCNSTSMINKK